ncbi:hypothetical protein [Ideonella sp.]|uniref:hypothetical protein n=1 Tax=Ideonella sp. TaxID=1929293 RepID=UPI0035B2E358
MTLIRSREFARQKRSLDVFARANRGYVYAISRFDDDDSTICTFGSMGYRDDPIKTGIGGVAPVTLLSMKNNNKVKASDQIMGGFVAGTENIGLGKSAVRNEQQGGAHAEELFLRKLPQMFDEFGEASKIDLFISRIPCANTSASWSLAAPGGNVLLPCGCGNKLTAVIQANPGITWRIWWEEEYPNATTQAACVAALNGLRGRAIVERYRG